MVTWIVGVMMIGIVGMGLGVSQACTLAWTPPTTYTDGSPVVGVLKYRLWFKARGEGQFVAIEDGLTGVSYTTETCEAGSYYMTVYQDTALESRPGNTLVLKKTEVVDDLKLDKP